nr:RNA-directed DNA polymerase, eukaryota [Tanacetum cinerariifolium]
MEVRDNVQKSKMKWAIEGDENLKFFHGIINKKRSQLSIRGVFVDGDWNTDLGVVQDAFKNHFAARFKQPVHGRLKLNISFTNRLSTKQAVDMDRKVSRDEICIVVWNCGENKSPGPDEYSFKFFRDIGDGPFFLNELLAWCKKKKKQAMLFKVDFAKAEWSDSNMVNIVKILKCFFLASGLKINIQKSQVLVLGVPQNLVDQATSSIGCAVMQKPFRYLRVMEGDYMSRKLAWEDTVQKLRSRLSNWKVKTLSIGGRLTLLKSVLGASPLYNMSIFKVPKGVLKEMEAIRSTVTLSSSKDRWIYDLNVDGEFRVKEVHIILDDILLPSDTNAMRWVKYIPIKINVFAWRAWLDRLPTRCNLIHRGVV